MDTRAVQLTIGGQSYKVVSSADEDELQRLADCAANSFTVRAATIFEFLGGDTHRRLSRP